MCVLEGLCSPHLVLGYCCGVPGLMGSLLYHSQCTGFWACREDSAILSTRGGVGREEVCHPAPSWFSLCPLSASKCYLRPVSRDRGGVDVIVTFMAQLARAELLYSNSFQVQTLHHVYFAFNNSFILCFFGSLELYKRIINKQDNKW